MTSVERNSHFIDALRECLGLAPFDSLRGRVTQRNKRHIRQATIDSTQLAEIYGVSTSTIRDIQREA